MRVTGCDANVYPPMSTQLEALGIALTEGFDASQLDGTAQRCRRVRHRQRRFARQSADGGDPEPRPAVRVRAAMAGGARAARQMGPRGGRNARQDDDVRDACARPRRRRPRTGLPHRRRADGFRRVGAAHRQRVLRDRGRRIRHGVLRQAIEVRALPAAHGDPQQPRVRSRGHLRRPRGDRDAVPSSRAHDSRRRPDHRQRRRCRARARARARCVERNRAFRRRGFERGTARAMDDRRRWRGHARRRRSRQAGISPITAATTG